MKPGHAATPFSARENATVIQTVHRALLVLLLAVGVAACSSTPKLPKTFLNPTNRLTAEEGLRLMEDGQRIVDDAEADIDRGKALVKDGRKRRKKGEALLSRGRQALRAAAMAEEAERLQLKAQDLKEEAIPLQ